MADDNNDQGNQGGGNMLNDADKAAEELRKQLDEKNKAHKDKLKEMKDKAKDEMNDPNRLLW